jgi:hypothetical protein
MSNRLPRLNPAELEALQRRLEQSNLSPNQQATIMASMLTAANPQAETAEYGYASLPTARRAIATQSIEDTSAVFASVAASTVIDLEYQQEYQESLVTAQNEGLSALEWSIVLGLLAFFLFPREQEKSLYESIESAYVAAWQLAIKEQALRYGCNVARVGSPSGSSLAEIRRMVKRDVESIMKTYDANAQSALRKLYDANPLAPISYYLNGMQEWANTRQLQKNLTIGINNVQAGYQLGLQDFHVKNALRTKYRFTGAPPVCAVCSRLMGMGSVDYETMASNPASVHPNCPHYWVSVNTYTIDCASIWTG